jgi:hypothetical protein
MIRFRLKLYIHIFAIKILFHVLRKLHLIVIKTKNLSFRIEMCYKQYIDFRE